MTLKQTSLHSVHAAAGAKLVDFGLAIVMDEAASKTGEIWGTPYYVAPEVWRNKPYNSKCDVWSLGCLLYELCTFRPPFEAESMEGRARKVMKGKYEQIPSFYSQALRSPPRPPGPRRPHRWGRRTRWGRRWGRRWGCPR
jgi:NIMA (never in mitosis gene a)-related kinase